VILSEERSGVVKDILEEREENQKRWGEQNYPMKSNDAGWNKHLKREAVQARDWCKFAFERGEGTWYNVLREEFCEVFAEDEPEKQYQELKQVAAVCIAAMEYIRRKK
jgi:hypothetical protein